MATILALVGLFVLLAHGSALLVVVLLAPLALAARSTVITLVGLVAWLVGRLSVDQ